MALLNNLAADSQTHAKSLLVLNFSPFNFAEQGEKPTHFFFLNTLPRIHHLYLKLLLFVVVANADCYTSTVGKFECIFRQVDQNLLKAHLVTIEHSRQSFLVACGRERCSKDLVGQLCILLFSLQVKYFHDELERFSWRELLPTCLKLPHLDYLKVKYIIYET